MDASDRMQGAEDEMAKDLLCEEITTSTTQEPKIPLFEQRKALMKESNKKAMRKLTCVIIITIFFVAAEILGGLYSHSIAIMSDAAHLTSDALGIGISVVALKIAERSSN
jgi:solute carrier family 30 (zinc transporter), member 2